MRVELAGLRVVGKVGLGLHTLGRELMLQGPRQDKFSRKTALLRLFKCLDELHLDQKRLYPHLHRNSLISVD